MKWDEPIFSKNKELFDDFQVESTVTGFQVMERNILHFFL